jgi:hypothetical protein
VHPPHVPLEPEAEPAEVRGRETMRPRVDSSAATITPGKLPCTISFMRRKKATAPEILAPAELVRHPLARPCASSRGTAAMRRRRPASPSA